MPIMPGNGLIPQTRFVVSVCHAVDRNALLTVLRVAQVLSILHVALVVVALHGAHDVLVTRHLCVAHMRRRALCRAVC